MTASEKRRAQNRIAQRRWRERQRSSGHFTVSAVDTEGSQKANAYRSSSRRGSMLPDTHDEVLLQPCRSKHASEDARSAPQKPGTHNRSVGGAPQTSFKAPGAVSAPNDLQASAGDMLKALLHGEDQAGEGSQQIDPQQLTASQLVSIACTAAWPAQNVFLPGCHFASALVRNGRRFGLDQKFLSDSASVSYIRRDWLSYQRSSRGAARLARTSKNLRSDLLLGGSSNGGKMGNTPHQDCVSPVSSSSTRTSATRTPAGRSEILTPPPESDDLPAPAEKAIQWEILPDNMFPTEAQLSVPHHPYIDVSFPWPSVRTKILTHLQHNIIDSRDLCDSVFLAGLQSNLDAEPAFIIWGDDAMDEAAWEVGESFARRWWFLLDDDIIRRTNWWRRRRGLPQISDTPDTALVEPYTLPQHPSQSPNNAS